jgi:hypothetical protein
LRPTETTLEQESLGSLFGRLVEDGRDVARAEVALYQEIAKDRASRSGLAVGFIGGALLLAIAATTMLLISLGQGLAHWIGPAWGSLVSALIGFAIAGLLVKLAVSRLTAVFSAKDAA